MGYLKNGFESPGGSRLVQVAGSPTFIDRISSHSTICDSSSGRSTLFCSLISRIFVEKVRKGYAPFVRSSQFPVLVADRGTFAIHWLPD